MQFFNTFFVRLTSVLTGTVRRKRFDAWTKVGFNREEQRNTEGQARLINRYQLWNGAARNSLSLAAHVRLREPLSAKSSREKEREREIVFRRDDQNSPGAVVHLWWREGQRRKSRWCSRKARILLSAYACRWRHGSWREREGRGDASTNVSLTRAFLCIYYIYYLSTSYKMMDRSI